MQRIEGVEKLFLRGAPVGEMLDVVDQQNIMLAVELAQFLHRP